VESHSNRAERKKVKDAEKENRGVIADVVERKAKNKRSQTPWKSSTSEGEGTGGDSGATLTSEKICPP